jgi:hypothetical protein
MTMTPMLVFTVLAVCIPIGLIIIFFVPIYLSLWTSLYWIYHHDEEKLNKIIGMKFHMSRVITQYDRLYYHWQHHSDKVDFETFTLPLFLPPAFGALASIVFSIYYICAVRNIFRVTD